MEKPLPDFATALAGYYPANPSPADSGVMSPMTPMSNYTQGSTPEQFVTSPDHLNYLEFCDSPLSNSDEGVIVSNHASYYDHQNWNNYTTVCNIYFIQSPFVNLLIKISYWKVTTKRPSFTIHTTENFS